MGLFHGGTSRASQLRTSMGEGKGDRGGFGKGFGKGDGKGKGKKGNKGKRGGKKDDEKDWTPLTKLGRLVKDGKIKSLEQIYLFSLPIKITAKCGSVRMRLIPAPKGTGIVAAGVPKKVLEFAGVDDCYTSSRGSTKTMGNFVKATFYCIKKLYGYLTPDFWKDTRYMPNPYQEFTDFLVRTQKA